MTNPSKVLVCATLVCAFALSSCETPVGQGAAVGAVTGALIGGSGRHGDSGRAAAGAAIGAGVGALIGAAIQDDQRRYYEERQPRGGYPFGRPAGAWGYVYSPYPPHRVVDVRGVPRGALVRDPSTGGVFRNP
jgi:hypothetical protein